MSKLLLLVGIGVFIGLVYWGYQFVRRNEFIDLFAGAFVIGSFVLIGAITLELRRQHG